MNDMEELMLAEVGIDRAENGAEFFSTGFDLLAILLAEPGYWNVESPIERDLYEALRRLSPDVKIEAQVKIGRYRADLVVNGRLVVECDGKEFHSTPAQMSADRVRDAAIKGAGFDVLRITGANIHKQPNRCAIAVLRRAGIGQ